MISKSRNFYFLTDAAGIDNLIGLNNRVEFFVTRLTDRQTAAPKLSPGVVMMRSYRSYYG
jgi:hypothetical protein